MANSIPRINPEYSGPTMSGGDPPDGSDMNTRLTVLETRLGTILPTIASKVDIEALRTDLHKEFTNSTRWTFAIVLTVAAVAVAILIFAMNRLAPPSTGQPTVLVLPPAAPAVQLPQPSAAPTEPPPKAVGKK